MGEWDDYCVICGGGARVDECIREPINHLLSMQIGHEKQASPDIDKLRLHERDRHFTEDLVLVGPFDEALDPIISAETRPSTLPSTDNTPWIVVAGNDLMTYPAEEVRVVEGLVLGGMLLGDLVRSFDQKNYSCNSNVYPFTHSRCLRLLNDCTLIKTPQLFWQVVRACNGIEWQLQGLRGIDYAEIADTQEQFLWCFALIPGNPDDWLGSFVFKPTLNEDDIQRFHAELTWLWTEPDRFPISCTFLTQEHMLSTILDIAKQGPTHLTQTSSDSQDGKECGITDLPVEVILLVAQNLDLISLLRFSATSKKLLHILFSHNSTTRIILEKTRPWCLPHGQMEERCWDEMLEERGGMTKNFSWIAYAKQCVECPSMRNRRRIWRIMEQMEAVAVKNGFILP